VVRPLFFTSYACGNHLTWPKAIPSASFHTGVDDDCGSIEVWFTARQNKIERLRCENRSRAIEEAEKLRAERKRLTEVASQQGYTTAPISEKVKGKTALPNLNLGTGFDGWHCPSIAGNIQGDQRLRDTTVLPARRRSAHAPLSLSYFERKKSLRRRGH
jgi:hypothetical protein